jgi:hypothetical protein
MEAGYFFLLFFQKKICFPFFFLLFCFFFVFNLYLFSNFILTVGDYVDGF